MSRPPAGQCPGVGGGGGGPAQAWVRLADLGGVIRIRRVPARLPIGHLYEIDMTLHGMPRNYKRTRTPNWLLEPILGSCDASDFVREADRQWAAGNTGWAVDFDEGLIPLA